MQSKWEMELWRAGQPVPDTKQDIAPVNAHPNFWDWLSGNIEEIAKMIGYTIAAYFGVGSAKYTDALAAGQALLKGADKASMAVGHAHVTGSAAFDEIRMRFIGWSEDDLKADTCKVVSAPSQAQSLGQTVEDKQYTAEFTLRTAGLADGSYLFLAGAQDDGWMYDVAATSQAEVVYQHGAWVPAVPGHQAPNVKVVSMVASRYAKISTLLAEVGVDLGGPGANNSDEKVHNNWAYGKMLPIIEQEAVRKTQVLAGQLTVFPSLYALVSTEMRKMVKFGHPGRDNPLATVHYNWANGLIQGNHLAQVRDELLAKLYVVLEPPVAFDFQELSAVALSLAQANRDAVDLELVRVLDNIQAETRAVPKHFRNLAIRR